MNSINLCFFTSQLVDQAWVVMSALPVGGGEAAKDRSMEQRGVPPSGVSDSGRHPPGWAILSQLWSRIGTLTFTLASAVTLAHTDVYSCSQGTHIACACQWVFSVSVPGHSRPHALTFLTSS
jgi:hypothetical protein